MRNPTFSHVSRMIVLHWTRHNFITVLTHTKPIEVLLFFPLLIDLHASFRFSRTNNWMSPKHKACSICSLGKAYAATSPASLSSPRSRITPSPRRQSETRTGSLSPTLISWRFPALATLSAGPRLPTTLYNLDACRATRDATPHWCTTTVPLAAQAWCGTPHYSAAAGTEDVNRSVKLSPIANCNAPTFTHSSGRWSHKIRFRSSETQVFASKQLTGKVPARVRTTANVNN